MTQATSAQPLTNELAWKPARNRLTLAQRRAAFEAQMRAMALSDLNQVSTRLKGLHAELERKDGRKWTHYQLASAMKIAPRTFQSWENGEVENTDGKGYDKMARWYSRKLGRKITRNWIVFGFDKAPPLETTKSPSMAGGRNGAEMDPAVRKSLAQISDWMQALTEAVVPLLEKAEADRLRQLADSAKPRLEELPADQSQPEG